MAFCVNCGSQVATGVRFCNNCGAAVQAGSAPAPTSPAAGTSGVSATPAAVATPGASSQGSNTLVKVLFAVLGVLALFALLATATCFYIGYRVKQRAANVLPQELGGKIAAYHGPQTPCAFLSEREAGDAIGQPITAVAQLGTSTCEYHFGPGGSHLFAIDYTWEGGAVLLGMSHAAMKQVSGMETFTPVTGIGDEAYVAPMGSGFMMRKGDVMVHLDLRASGISVDAAEQMARKIAGRL
jgi:hypothetical protein